MWLTTIHPNPCVFHHSVNIFVCLICVIKEKLNKTSIWIKINIMLSTFSIFWYNRIFHWKGNNSITNGRNFYHGISTNTQMLQFWHHGSMQKRDFRAPLIQVQSCLPLTVKLFFLSLLQSWMVIISSMAHCIQLHHTTHLQTWVPAVRS